LTFGIFKRFGLIYFFQKMARNIRGLTGIPFYQTAFTPAIPNIQGVHQLQTPFDAGTSLKFQVISKGFGSVLAINLDPNDQVYSRVGSTLCSFGNVETQLRLHKTITKSALHRLTGGSFFMEQVLVLVM
jgi:hypothetical protein